MNTKGGNIEIDPYITERGEKTGEVVDIDDDVSSPHSKTGQHNNCKSVQRLQHIFKYY